MNTCLIGRDNCDIDGSITTHDNNTTHGCTTNKKLSCQQNDLTNLSAIDDLRAIFRFTTTAAVSYAQPKLRAPNIVRTYVSSHNTCTRMNTNTLATSMIPDSVSRIFNATTLHWVCLQPCVANVATTLL